MHSQVQEIDPVTVEVKVEVPWDRIQKGLDDTFGRLQRTAKVKGFRPGKAPKSVVVQLFSKEVKSDVASSLMEESLIAAVKQHELPVVSNAMVETIPSIENGKPLAFTAKFEVRPKIEKLETGLSIAKVMHTVGDTEIDAEIERLRGEHAVMEPVEPARPAAKGDTAVIDFVVTVDGNKNEGDSGTDRRISLGDGRVLPELEAGILGLDVGGTRAVTVTRPADDGNKELAGKVVVFDVTLKELQSRRLPAIDDDFAKDVGEYESLADLKSKVKGRLEEQANGRTQNDLREAVVDAFVKANPVPVPPSLIDQQFRSMAQEYLQIFQMMGQEPRIDDDLIKNMRERAEEKVRAALLLGDLARREKIEATTDEIDAKLLEIATKSGKHIAKVKAEHQGEKREALETSVLEAKLIAHLVGKATITEKTPAQAEADAKAASEAKSAEAKEAAKSTEPDAKAKKATKKTETKADAEPEQLALLGSEGPSEPGDAPKKTAKKASKKAQEKSE
jgi:trigger factor